MVARNSISLYKQNNGVDWFGSDKSLRHFQESDRHHEKRNNRIRWIFSLPQNRYSWVYLGWRLNSASDTISNFESAMANRRIVGQVPTKKTAGQVEPWLERFETFLSDNKELKLYILPDQNWNHIMQKDFQLICTNVWTIVSKWNNYCKFLTIGNYAVFKLIRIKFWIVHFWGIKGIDVEVIVEIESINHTYFGDS